MTVSEKIRDDWGTIAHFAKNHEMNPQCLYSTLNGRVEYTSIVKKLITVGYINSREDLLKPLSIGKGKVRNREEIEARKRGFSFVETIDHGCNQSVVRQEKLNVAN